ncbi:MAG: aminomethyl-transferring glycine dehydrogenase subunit GcvPA [Deltaproteobacteria bacterium]|nr:aminomethyl-transferring glycine dehydrogenase subunit GcvPA [Deltaproteobacteria bacterium]
MPYIPHTDEDIAAMLEAVGTPSVSDLFTMIPAECRAGKDLDLPANLTEWELKDHMGALAEMTAREPEYTIFLGAGSYRHYVPESLTHILNRTEFVTSYTPYQPELSQGTLQAIYEYQTLMARLLGMEISNASLYDGASALAEALLMAARVTKRKTVALSNLIHPFYRDVVRTYLEPSGHEIIEISAGENGTTDCASLDNVDELAAVALQSPNFFGCIEALAQAADLAHKKQALFITVFTEPLAYGLYKNPGSLGADIVCGEGQSLGISQSFGGPGLGMFATKMEYVRHMPGRLVGRTKDVDGRDGYVLTLATREQHIRRGKATSNICTNNSLCALAATVYLASLGATGMRDLARLNYDKTEYLKELFRKARFEIPFPKPTFNEFVVKMPAGSESIYKRMLEKGIVAGLPLDPYYPELTDHYLLCVTEVISKEDMDALVTEAKS